MTDLLEPHLGTKKTESVIGTMLLGTVAGDIHDLGKICLPSWLVARGFM